MRTKTFLIMAGGTGGHVYPALATAKNLQQHHDKIAWLGSVGGMEESIVAQTDIPFFGISIKGVRGNGVLVKLLSPFRLLWAVLQAISVIYKVKPDCVLGMGGFASGPGGLAARLMGKPLLIHEQNAVAGLTNRMLAKIANSVMAAFPHAFDKKMKVTLVGNPLSQNICDIYYRPKTAIPAARNVRLLVLGGSLGAARLNECVPETMALLDDSIRPDVWHQTGRQHDLKAVERYQSRGVEAKVTPYIDDMGEAYQWADFVVCRAGALTVSELCVAGLGAILVPYPYAVDDHQTLNAKLMVSAGAAWLLPQSDLDPVTLAEILRPLLNKRERIALLSNSAHKLGKPDATEKVAAECRRVCYA